MGIGDAHDRWRRQRRRHDRIEDAVDDVAWAGGRLNDALKPRSGCAVVVLAGAAAVAAASSAVGGWWL
jgi:hypothetical protein